MDRCSALLLLAEVFVGVSLLLNKTWTLHVLQRSLSPSLDTNPSLSSPPSSSPSPPSPISAITFEKIGGVAGWIVLGSVGLNILVVLWDWMLARSVVESDSIPKAFLSTTAFQLWSIKSYAHFCLLTKIKWGHNMRQRMVMAVYFGLQGFTSALVTLPRLALYVSIIYAVKSIPDLGTSALGFQWLQLEDYSSFNANLAICTLAVIAMSSIVHALSLARILIAGLICSCSVCCLGRIKRTIDRDLKCRIVMHVLSTCHSSRFRHETYDNKDSPSELNLSKRTDQRRTSGKSEKSGITFQYDLDTIEFGRDSQGAFDEVDLGPEPTKTAATKSSTTTNNSVPMVKIIPRGQNFLVDTSAAPSIRGSQRYRGIPPPPPPQQYIMTDTHISQPTWIPAGAPTLGQQAGLMSREGIVRSDASSMVPGSGLAALSFYDDLLKSINSERMMYASSLSNQATAEFQQLLIDSKCSKQESSLPLKSSPMALLSSTPPSYSNCSNYFDRGGGDKPVHPFDTIAHCHSSATLQGELDNNRPSLSKAHETLSEGFYFSSLSRSESSNSQETIENWRIRVEPSSPSIPELDMEMRKSTAGIAVKTTQGIGMHSEYDYDFNGDGVLDQYEDSISRRGTIPIILSSHLLEASSAYPESQDNNFSTDDLHLPRPSYAYSQTRSQRQGSVNSSIGGYNYSVASSPSLADSLSNPMYQQQSYGIMNGSNCPRTFPPRKCSLPILVQSSVKDESVSRALNFEYQLSQSHIPQHLACPTFSTRTRTRLPSHLSNMVNHSEIRSSCDFRTDGDVDRPNIVEREKPLPIQKKTHFRSQSFGAQSGGHQSVPSWDQTGYFKGSQIGYASLVDLAPSSKSHMYYQGQENDSIFESSTKINASSKMSLKEALAIDSHIQGYSNSFDRGSQNLPAPYYSGEIDDQFVHPLDLSPLLLQPQLGSQQGYHGHGYNPSTMNHGDNSYTHQDDVQAAWTETCIGLGLTFNSNPYIQQKELYHDGPVSMGTTTEQYALQRPVPVKYPMNQHSSDINNGGINGYHWNNPVSQPELTTRVTTATELSNETLTNPCQTTTTNVRNDYENEMLRYHKQQLNAAITNQRLSQTKHQEPNTIQRQPSQRNKKHLVVNIVPLKSY
ncbi:hypothetical protein BGX26_000605 [Mortierella sp. AD094]|nr:hypothetical protein BGX26_000605 [Mortierella sp. AD094]